MNVHVGLDILQVLWLLRNGHHTDFWISYYLFFCGDFDLKAISNRWILNFDLDHISDLRILRF